MKIALIGYGKMGRLVESIAIERGHAIVARCASKSWDMEALRQADLCIEFSHPDYVIEHIQLLASLKKDLIIGTTGWYDKLDQVEAIVAKEKIGALYAPNFSVGIYLLLEILNYASALINTHEEYDVAGIESHHQKKVDAPSGTAQAIARVIENNIQRVESLPFYSVRCGSIPGTHTILFDSCVDQITITHEARNREGFAKGAVQAAEWVLGKKGLYTFSDYMQMGCTQSVS